MARLIGTLLVALWLSPGAASAAGDGGRRWPSQPQALLAPGSAGLTALPSPTPQPVTPTLATPLPMVPAPPPAWPRGLAPLVAATASAPPLWLREQRLLL